VPQGVDGDVFVQAGGETARTQIRCTDPSVMGRGDVSREEPSWDAWPSSMPEHGQESWREHHVAILAAFA